MAVYVRKIWRVTVKREMLFLGVHVTIAMALARAVYKGEFLIILAMPINQILTAYGLLSHMGYGLFFYILIIGIYELTKKTS